jgi:hypothetical protein
MNTDGHRNWMSFLPDVSSAFKYVSTRSILSAPLTVFISLSFSTPLVAYFTPIIIEQFTWLLIASGLWLAAHHLYWTFKDPDRLHAEETYTALRNQEMYGDDKGGPPTIDAVPIGNPSLSVPNEKKK